MRITKQLAALLVVLLAISLHACARPRTSKITNDLGEAVTLSVDGPAACMLRPFRFSAEGELMLYDCDLRDIRAIRYTSSIGECDVDLSAFRRGIETRREWSVALFEEAKLSAGSCANVQPAP